MQKKVRGDHAPGFLFFAKPVHVVVGVCVELKKRVLFFIG